MTLEKGQPLAQLRQCQHNPGSVPDRFFPSRIFKGFSRRDALEKWFDRSPTLWQHAYFQIQGFLSVLFGKKRPYKINCTINKNSGWSS
jgi:hypothetical protein